MVWWCLKFITQKTHGDAQPRRTLHPVCFPRKAAMSSEWGSCLKHGGDALPQQVIQMWPEPLFCMYQHLLAVLPSHQRHL